VALGAAGVVQAVLVILLVRHLVFRHSANSI
jgi:hypothetical protein